MVMVMVMVMLVIMVMVMLVVMVLVMVMVMVMVIVIDPSQAPGMDGDMTMVHRGDATVVTQTCLRVEGVGLKGSGFTMWGSQLRAAS